MLETMLADTLADWVMKLPRPWSFFILLGPLVLVIAMVYKGAKVESTPDALRQGVNMFASIMGVMALIAVGLTMVIRYS